VHGFALAAQFPATKGEALASISKALVRQPGGHAAGGNKLQAERFIAAEGANGAAMILPLARFASLFCQSAVTTRNPVG
jgi:hypothetical protein